MKMVMADVVWWFGFLSYVSIAVITVMYKVFSAITPQYFLTVLDETETEWLLLS